MSQLEHTIHDMYTALVHEANVCLEAVIASSRVTAAHPHHPSPALASPPLSSLLWKYLLSVAAVALE